MSTGSAGNRAKPAYIAGEFGEFLWAYTLVFLDAAGNDTPDILGPVFRTLHGEFRHSANGIFVQSHFRTGSSLQVSLSGAGDEPNQLWPIYQKLRGLFPPTYPYYALSGVLVQADKSVLVKVRVVGSEDPEDGVENLLIMDASKLGFDVIPSRAIGAMVIEDGEVTASIGFNPPQDVLILGPSFTFHLRDGEADYRRLQEMFAGHGVFLPGLTPENLLDLQG